MACSKSTAPVNISSNNSQGECFLKCNYKYNYGITSCYITNNDDHLSLKYINPGKSEPVTFNNDKYDVKEVRIYQPSLNTYNGNKVSGEMIILHNSINTGKQFIVSIPILSGNISSKGSTQLNSIVSEASTSIPNNGEAINISLNKFTLDTFVSQAPFYSYTATLPYGSCDGSYEYVAYNTDNGLYIEPDNVKKLQKIITENHITVKDTKIFYNSKGPNSQGSGNDEIYIDCQPVNEEGSILVSENNGKGSNSDGTHDTPVNISEILSTPGSMVIIGLIIGYIIIKLITYIFNKSNGSNNA
jgi:carbonic anhydrase